MRIFFISILLAFGTIMYGQSQSVYGTVDSFPMGGEVELSVADSTITLALDNGSTNRYNVIRIDNDVDGWIVYFVDDETYLYVLGHRFDFYARGIFMSSLKE
jgi:hypothetical protein